MKFWCFDSQATENPDGSITYDREYGSSEIREVVGKLIGNGVYATPATNMQVAADGGMTVRVRPGCCWISGAFGAVEEGGETLTLEPGGSSARTDLIVARFDLSLSYRSIRLAAVSELVRNESVYDIQLARVEVRAGATSITQSDITDTRYTASLCGIVTGVIEQIDTTGVFAQFQAAFDTFMENLEYTLSGDVAANLLLLINTHSANSDVHVTTTNKANWDSKAAGNHTHTPASIGAAASSHTHTPSQVGLGNVANERQYSASNPPPGGELEIFTVTSSSGRWSGTISFSFAPSIVMLMLRFYKNGVVSTSFWENGEDSIIYNDPNDTTKRITVSWNTSTEMYYGGDGDLGTIQFRAFAFR